MATQTELLPNQHDTEAVTAHVIWMTSGLGGDDLGHQPEPRGIVH